MLTTVILSVVATLTVLGVGIVVFGWLDDKLKSSHKRQEELHNRLRTLEDRFFHPANYDQAFFRPVARKNNDTTK